MINLLKVPNKENGVVSEKCELKCFEIDSTLDEVENTDDDTDLRQLIKNDRKNSKTGPRTEINDTKSDYHERTND